MNITYGSVCSGIESASIAWEPLGMTADWFSEIEPFPCAVLKHHWPEVPNFGDMKLLPAAIRMGLVKTPDVLVGGTPCQAFSGAGNRESLDDARGQLTLTYVDLANAIDEQRGKDDECIVTWENVPGVLNTADNAFGCFLGELAGSGCELFPSTDKPADGKSTKLWRWDKKSKQHRAKWSNAGCVFGPKRTIAWRVIDAQYFGVPQRRKRVFVVASSRKGFDPCKVSFEFEGVRRDIAPSRKTREDITNCITASVGNADRDAQCNNLITSEIAHCLQTTCNDYSRADNFNMVIQPNICSEISPTVTSGAPFSKTGDEFAECDEMVYRNAPRRLTPIECERLQGFPDTHTRIPYRNKSVEDCPDGPRYKAIGNSKAVPCIQFIGVRIMLEMMGLL